MADDYGYEGLYGRAIRALSGARDWISDYTDPNRPRQRNAVDVNLPVAPPIEKPWYEKIPTPESLGEVVGKRVGPTIKSAVTDTGGATAGVLGSLSESTGRAAGALLDVTNPRNTGSEQKPMSDVVWEGLKGIKSGYDKPFGETTSVSQEVGARVPEEIKEKFSPFGKAYLGLATDIVTDPTNLIPAKAAAIPLAGAAKLAWLPPSLFKKARNIEGFTTQLGSKSHAAKILAEGFGIPESSDILGRWGHASSYTPETGKAARIAGHPPIGTSNQSYTGSSYAKYLPVDFGPEVKVLDTVDVPVPKEDIDEILSTLHPVKDKNKIAEIKAAWEDQAKYVMEHSDVRSGKVPVEKLAQHYKQIQKDPVALDAVRRLNRLLGEGGTTYGAGYGTHGNYSYGQSPLNQPSQTVEFGAIHYPDYNTSGNYPSIAFDPRQTLFAPLESNLDPTTTPWQKGKLAPLGTPNPKGGYYTGLMPPDVPGRVSKPIPGQAAVPPDVFVPQTPEQIQQAKWAAENANPPKVKLKKPKVYPESGPLYARQPISTYEQGTLKELAAAGRPLDKVQTKKLAAIQEYESGRAVETRPNPLQADLEKEILAPVSEPLSLTPEEWDKVAKLQGQGHSEDEAIEFIKGGHVPDDYFKNLIPPESTLDQHYQDVENIFEEYGLAVPESYQLKSNSTPAELHEDAINYLKDIGADSAAADLQQLWDMKKTPALPDDIPGFTDEEIGLGNKLGDVHPMDALSQGDGQLLQAFINEFENPEAYDTDIMEMWGDMPTHMKKAFQEARPDLFDDLQQMNMPGYPMGGGPGKVPAGKATIPQTQTEYKLKIPSGKAEDMLGGTQNKEIYTKDGQDYLFKEANPAFIADQEVAANTIATLAGLHPIKIEKQTMGGKSGTMQAAVGNNFNWPTLKEADLTKLTAEELRDVIKNHPVDWLTGNMDAHGAQFLRTPNGIVEVDRGRAFKNYQSNKLHEDYNPTGGVGYYDQVYNDIVKLYKKGKLPQLTEGDINSALDQTIFKMKQNEIPIMQEIHKGLDRSNQGHLDVVANTRMSNLRQDLLKFWTGK